MNGCWNVLLDWLIILKRPPFDSMKYQITFSVCVCECAVIEWKTGEDTRLDLNDFLATEYSITNYSQSVVDRQSSPMGQPTILPHIPLVVFCSGMT